MQIVQIKAPDAGNPEVGCRSRATREMDNLRPEEMSHICTAG